MTFSRLSADIIEDRPVTGFSARVEAEAQLPEAEIADRLKAGAQELGTGLPGHQSLAGDLFRKIVARIRGRRLLQDHGTHEVHVEWLCSHVPPGGTARLQITDSTNGSGGIKFSIVGTGLGDGWSFKAKLHRDFLERSRCMMLVETFKVHVRGYAFEDDASDLEYRCDVVERIGTSARELSRCPYCDPPPEAAMGITQKAGPAIDLSRDTVGQKLSEQIVLAGKSEVELGIDAKVLGELGVSAGIIYNREVSFTCAVDYTFPGGRAYQPMQRFQYPDLPFWRVG